MNTTYEVVQGHKKNVFGVKDTDMIISQRNLMWRVMDGEHLTVIGWFKTMAEAKECAFKYLQKKGN